MIESFFVNNLF